MSRNSGNVSKTKKLSSGAGNNSKHNRKPFKNLSDSSSISSNRNSHSEEDIRVSGSYLRPQLDKDVSYEEQEERTTKKLQAKVKELRHKLRVLEESVDSKDYSLGTIAREKDRATGEIRRLERSNKLLRQQLNDERNHYLEEKEKFCEEMTKYKRKLQDVKSDTDGKKSSSLGRQPLINQSLRWQISQDKGDFADTRRSDVKKSKSQKLLGSIESRALSLIDSETRKPSSEHSLRLYEGDDVSLQMAALKTENAKLRSIICERDERNYELCLRFLRMKHYKNDIRNRFQDLENEYLQVIANLMDKIDEARQEFNFIIDQKFKKPLHSTNAMYLQMVQKNSRMAFENASLRLENQCLKKEINKHANSSPDCERKMHAEPAVDKTNSKTELEDNKNETGKLKKIKKNVNFKEIRTIYERCLTFKTSDTDSNYMSKTSTTVPSNVSLVDPKSNESIIEHEEPNITKEINCASLEANALPEEILQRIFKRVDTSSCQTIDSERSKGQKTDAKKKDGFSDKVDLAESIKIKSNEMQVIPREDVTIKKVQKQPIIIEHKSPSKITDSSSPCESKESIRIHLKEPEHPPIRPEKRKKDNYLAWRRPGKQGHQWTFNSHIKPRVRCDWKFDRESEERSNLDFPLRRFTFPGKKHWGRLVKTSPLLQGCQSPKPRQPRYYEDNCGLQEKLEFSDLELPACAALSGVCNQITVEPGKTMTADDDRRIVVESDDDLGEKFGICAGLKSLTPAVGSRSRSSNKLNLQDELAEATLHQFGFDEPYWRKENTLQSVHSRSSSKTYRAVNEDGNTFRDPQDSSTDIHISTQEAGRTQQRKPEASKRFSQRLFSTSPEQLKNILTESQLGRPFRVAPIIIGHATTEISPAFKHGETNSEIFLQLVLPHPSPRRSTLFSDNEVPEKRMAEKEASTCEISPVHPSKLSNQTDACASDIRIPISSLPTSNSTMEVVDSLTFERRNIMMRTFSAPGLLESNWLDPYTVCETRDCSTNT